METSLSQFIKHALEYYDNQNFSYFELIDNQDVVITIESITFNIKKKSKIFDYEILGYYDNQNRIWIWGWVLADLDSTKTKLCRELLNYGLKLDPSSNSTEHFILKSFLLNSRIKIDEYIELEIKLAIFSYILKDKIYFIYPRKRYTDKNNNNYVTFYYLIY
jgi:hypothetical protein